MKSKVEKICLAVDPTAKRTLFSWKNFVSDQMRVSNSPFLMSMVMVFVATMEKDIIDYSSLEH